MKHLFCIFTLMIMFSSCYAQQTKTENNMGKDFLTLAAERYSVRSFLSTPVEQEKIDKIIEAGKLAPTAVNSQPQKIYVIKSAEALKKANEISPCIYGAPSVFLICYDDNHVCKRGESGNYGDIDCTIVLTHMMLEAYNLGIGTCIVGMFTPEEAVKAFNLPKNIHPVLLMPFGYPAEDAQPSPRHTEYRPLDETVEVL